MAIGRVIEERGTMFPDFDMFEINYELSETNWEMKFFLNIPNITKVDVLEYFEEAILNLAQGPFGGVGGLMELDTIFFADLLDDIDKITIHYPTYISEYINIIGQLFLAGYIDFGSYCEDAKIRRTIDYPTNLSYYKEDKYQAWVYFRDNFFYKNAYNKSDDDDIMIYEGKEYSTKDCPTYFNKKENNRAYRGYSTMYSPTSWDTPKYWSQYNIWVAQTPKGKKYFEEILAPRFYNKYKDLSVEIDEKGNIVRWIGKINR